MKRGILRHIDFSRADDLHVSDEKIAVTAVLVRGFRIVEVIEKSDRELVESAVEMNRKLIRTVSRFVLRDLVLGHRFAIDAKFHFRSVRYPRAFPQPQTLHRCIGPASKWETDSLT